MTALLIVTTIFLFVAAAPAQYRGGSGTADDPYQIATAADLIVLGETPEDYDKHIILTADIDLGPNLPGRKVFHRAPIAPDTDNVKRYFQGTAFSGTFDGNGHAISHLTIAGGGHLGFFGKLDEDSVVEDLAFEDVSVQGTDFYVGGLAGYIRSSRVRNCSSTGTVGGNWDVGGLVGYNSGSITTSYSAGTINGEEINIGGLVGQNYGRITTSYSIGTVCGDGDVGGLVGENQGGVVNCYSTGRVDGNNAVGGLVGYNQAGSVTRCHSRSGVSGEEDVGGLAGSNGGNVHQCCSTGAVRGGRRVGGLVGYNDGSITTSYSTGAVSGSTASGGLVGSGSHGHVSNSLWDMEKSGIANSDGGTGKITAEMQMARTFMGIGWDFVGETANGAEDIWWIREGQDYPRLRWELWASVPNPPDRAIDVIPPLLLRWGAGGSALWHDVYFADNAEAVSSATTESQGIYRCRQPVDITTYDPGTLDWGTTYYWRIDEVNDTDHDSPWKGKIWSFTMADFRIALVVDDFESYSNEIGARVFEMWIDGLGFTLPEPGQPGNGTGSTVGYESWTPSPYLDKPIMETEIVHGGQQSMPFYYDNTVEPYYSETDRAFTKPSYWSLASVGAPQDWTIDDADTLTLYFHGEADNDPEPLYVRIEDSAGHVAMVRHPDVDAVLAAEWQKWQIPLVDLQTAGVNAASVRKMIIGVGDRDEPQPGGTGLIYIDDIWVTKQR